MSRGLTMLGIAAAFTLGAVSLLQLVAGAYAGVAQRQLDMPAAPSTVEAARLAASLTPWSSAHAALRGWLAAEAGDAGEMQRRYLQALRWAPADPLLWAEFALARARVGMFDATLQQAVAQAQRLAPASPPVRRSLADMGLSYWGRGSPELRALWLDSMQYQLMRNPAALLGPVLTRGRTRSFCEGPAVQLGQGPWCEALGAIVTGGCFDVTPRGAVPCTATR